MKHVAIVELLLRHPFYADGRCSDFVIEPSVETERLLRNHRCLCAKSPDGVRIVTPLAATGQPFLPLPATAALRLHLKLRNRELDLFTDLTAFSRGRSLPVFTNAGTTTASASELQLAARAEDPPRSAPDVFADVEIRFDGFFPDRIAQLATFHVSFPVKRARWAYYCVTDLAPTASELQIVDGSPGQPDDLLLFSAANRTKLDEQPDPTDPIAAQLASQYPGLRCFRFISDQPVACRQQPRKYLELRLGDDRLVSPLPNPSLRDAVSEDLLFRIVKYRTQPFQNL